MADATPLLLITDAGLAAASVATPTGPFIEIVRFEIGAAFGYTPQRTDTGIVGPLLYGANVSSYQSLADNVLDVVCQIPATAGPWDFGEVALYLPNNVLFAKAVFATAQHKSSSLGTDVGSAYILNCLLSLKQSTAIFQFSEASLPYVWDVYTWSSVIPPAISANPAIPLTLVHELTPLGDTALLENATNTWTVGTGYKPVVNAAPVVNSTTTWVEFVATLFAPSDLTSANREWLLQTPDGYFRSVSSITQSGANYRFNLNTSNDGTYNNFPLIVAPSAGQNCRLYAYNRTNDRIRYSQIIDPPAIPLATVGNPGLAYGGSGLYMPQAGVIQTFGLLHGPSANTGRQLTSADSLNSNLNSGVYTVSAAFGYPAAMPVSWDGQVFVTNPGISSNTSIIQTYYPTGSGGGTADGTGGYPIFWRSYNASAGIWTNWSQLSTGGRGASVMAYAKSNSTSFTLTTGVWNVGCWAYTHSNTYPANQLYINGVMVDYTANHGDPEGTGYTSMFGKTQVTAVGSQAFTANAAWADTTGDWSILVVAVPA